MTIKSDLMNLQDQINYFKNVLEYRSKWTKKKGNY